MRLGEILIERRLITQEDLDRALELQRERGDKLGKILVDLGFVAMRDVLARAGRAVAGSAARDRRSARRFRLKPKRFRRNSCASSAACRWRCTIIR